MRLYFVRRDGPDDGHSPDHEHALFTRRDDAREWAGSSKLHAWVWDQGSEGEGWFLVRWNGLDLDYGRGAASMFLLPDGTKAAFVHDRDEWPWALLAIAEWKGRTKPPRWLAAILAEEAAAGGDAQGRTP